MKPLLLFLLLVPRAAAAADLLDMPPPCPAPADVGASSADLDPAQGMRQGVVPADMTPRRPVNLDIPLYLPQSTVRGGKSGASNSTNATATQATSATTNGTLSPDSVETDIPIGGVAIRNDKVVSVQAMGQEYMNSASGVASEGAPGCRRP